MYEMMLFMYKTNLISLFMYKTNLISLRYRMRY